MGNVSAFGFLRVNKQETTLLGYRIPERSLILPNFLAVKVDPTVWEDPLAFRPERFLDSEGKAFEPPQFMPYSIGKENIIIQSDGFRVIS